MKITEALNNVYTAMGGEDEFPLDDIATGVDLLKTVAGGGSGGLSVMTTAEFVQYIEDKGWHKGTYSFTLDGVEYTAGSANKYGILSFPRGQFTNTGDGFIVVSDDTTEFVLDGNPVVSDNSATSSTIFQIHKQTYWKSITIVMLSKAGCTFTSVDRYGLTALMCGSNHKYTSSQLDMSDKYEYLNKGLTITRGANVRDNASHPSISIEGVTLDAEKLTALLALLNQQ